MHYFLDKIPLKSKLFLKHHNQHYRDIRCTLSLGKAVLEAFIKMSGSIGKLYKHPFTVCVEGNIGSGKTTFLSHFKKFENITVLEEPVELWRNVSGTNLLVSDANITLIYISSKFSIIIHARCIAGINVQ